MMRVSLPEDTRLTPLAPSTTSMANWIHPRRHRLLAPPGTGWRMALSPQEPEPTGYLVACFFLLGLTNAGFRSVERCYQIKPDPWRRHLIYPWIWSQLHVAYDAAAVGLRFEDAEGWIVYYCFTMLAYFFHSVTLILLYSWVMMENFQGVPLRR